MEGTESKSGGDGGAEKSRSFDASTGTCMVTTGIHFRVKKTMTKRQTKLNHRRSESPRLLSDSSSLFSPEREPVSPS